MERTRTSQILLIFFRILFTLLVLWTLWFIFHNALEPGALSSAHSQAVTDALGCTPEDLCGTSAGRCC